MGLPVPASAIRAGPAPDVLDSHLIDENRGSNRPGRLLASKLSMTLFARCFLLVFCQMGVGGLLSLSVPPFHDIARGYYKSSAGVFLFCALVGGGGSIYLRISRGPEATGTLEAIVWAIFLVLLSAYMATLWGESERLRARLYVASLLAGFAGLVVSGLGIVGVGGPIWGVLTIADTFAGAAALGGVTCGMLIGHWYLIDPGMEIEPFHRCFRFFVGAIVVETILLGVITLVALLGGTTSTDGYASLAGLRMILGPAAALAMAWMIGRVLAIPQTMAATGLFYIATLAVLVGSFLGRYFTFRTGLPF